MASISTIASTVSTAANGLANLIFVSPQNTVGYQPQPASGTNGAQQPTLVFHYEGEQTVVLESDITDHYVEDNTAIQDQIALKPTKITTHGFIGELNDILGGFPQPSYLSNALLEGLQVAANKLTEISPYTPGLSTTALVAYNEAVFTYNTGVALANSATNSALFGAVSGETVITGTAATTVVGYQTKQQNMFQQLFGYYSTRTLFTVQTPWAIFQNMAIETLRAVQDAETNVISEFEITFKNMRFATTFNGLPTQLNSQQILSNMSASGVNTSTNLTPGPTFSVDFNPSTTGNSQ